LFILFSLKLLYPDYVFLNKGNHENRNLNGKYGFEGNNLSLTQDECFEKYDGEVFELIQKIFEILPLGILLNENILIIHGGSLF
jgi:serine/threonine-protein phosphatase 5